MTWKQHLKLRCIQIDCWTPTSSPLQCYTLCIQMFRAIQFDPRGLTSSEETLSPYFERSLGHHFPIPYLDTFSIAGSRADGLKIVFWIFCDLQTVPGVSRYTICLLECPVMSPTVHRSFQYLATSWFYVHDMVNFHACTCCNQCVSNSAYRFLVPYLDTFLIVGSWTGGLRTMFPMFCD